MTTTLCGIDEAGRGPLAGPVTAACVVLGPDFPVDRVNDSKRMTERQRDAAFRLIVDNAIAWGIGWCSHVEIDRINVLQASLEAMRRAFVEMNYRCDRALVDGNQKPSLGIPVEAIVGGDASVPCISAASILAKVARDRWMVRWAWIDDRYGFERHKGYPTRAHRQSIAVHGLSDIHRKSFQWDRNLTL